MNVRIKKASSLSFLAILFSPFVFFGSFIATTAVLGAIADRVVHEPPSIMMSHEGIFAEKVLWRLGSKKSALEFVRVDEWSDYGTGASATTAYLGPRISFVSDVAADIRVKDLRERQRTETTDATGSGASTFQTGNNPAWCDSSGERDCGLYRDPTGKCDSMAVNDCMFYRL